MAKSKELILLIQSAPDISDVNDPLSQGQKQALDTAQTALDRLEKIAKKKLLANE